MVVKKAVQEAVEEVVTAQRYLRNRGGKSKDVILGVQPAPVFTLVLTCREGEPWNVQRRIKVANKP